MAVVADHSITRVRLFGAGGIERDGHPLATRTRKELHLLALLLLRHDRLSDRDWLAEELWPESAQPLYNLSRSLANLKIVLGGDEMFRIEKPTPRTLRLHPESLEVDLLTFDRLIRQGNPAALADAVDLYCGPLLKSCMDEWIVGEREAREQSCLRALRELADVARSESDLVTADSYLRRARAIDPLNEETIRALMQTLADRGELAAANQVYRRLRQGLSEQLLPGPDPRTQALFESLQSGATTAISRSKHPADLKSPVDLQSAGLSSRIPRPVHRLVGREREVWEVSACLTQTQLVTLIGIGGMGKTRLAIELAAARVGEMSVDQIAERLDDRFQLLQGGKRGVPRRQQALQGSMDWSYDLLTPAERTLLHRLAVFAGGWTTEATRFVCGEGLDEVDGLLSRLVDRSLVVREEPVREEQVRETQRRVPQGIRSVRYRLLETVREYARKRLAASGDAEAVRRRHRDYFLKMAEDGVENVSEWKTWLAGIASEHDNFRAALDFCANNSHPSSDSVDAGLRLATAMHRVWEDCGFFTEGRTHLDAALVRAASRPDTIACARALYVAGTLANFQGDYRVARTQLEQALHVARTLGNQKVAASALASLGTNCWWQGDYAQAQAFYEESLTHTQEAEEHIASTVLSNLGEIAREQGDYERARSLLEDGLTRARRVGDPSVVVTPLTGLGNVAHNQGDYRTARALYSEALALLRDLGDPWRIALLLGNLGSVAQAQEDYAEAIVPLEECLLLLLDLGDKRNGATALISLGSIYAKIGDSALARTKLTQGLEMLRQTGDRYFSGAALAACGSLARTQGEMEWAASLFGAAQALYREMGASLPPVEAAAFECEVEAIRSTLGISAFERWWAIGQSVTLEQVTIKALSFLNGVPLLE